MLASFSTLNEEIDEWAVFPNYKTYVELEDGVSIEQIHQAALDVLKVNGGTYGEKFTEVLSYPLEEIYLEVEWYVHDELRGNIEYIQIFLIIGILILTIACINYMNLATARASLRSMEIGVRKATGAFRSQLVHQFLSESVLLACTSAVFAIGLIELLLPGFNQVTGKTLALNFIANPEAFVLVLGVAIATGLLAGVYPALFLSGFHTVSVLKGQFKTGKAAIYLRKGLVVTQFVITIGLIVCTTVINNQLNFLSEKGLGLDTESLVSIPAKNDIDSKYQAFKSELLKNPNVVGVTTGQILLGGISFETFSDDDQLENKPSGNTLQIFGTDHDFVSTLGLNLIAGRDFDPKMSQDATNSILMNETSIEEFGWTTADEALGQEIVIGEKTYSVIGLVEDFHALSPVYSILPAAIRITDTAADQVLVRLKTGDLQNSVASLKTAWAKFEPFLPFEVNFMDDELYALYVSERNLSILFNAFAFLTIFIACLGLLGLSTFTAEQRRKEIGIRKVLGASVKRILALVTKDLVYLLGISFAVATPISWYFINQWIENYPYRIEIGWGVFVVGGLLALSLALLTVSYQSMKAALSNPIDSLKTE